MSLQEPPQSSKTINAIGMCQDQNKAIPQPGGPGQHDIRLFMMNGAKQSILHASNAKNLAFSIPKSTEDPIDKMRMIRNKMVEERRKEENSMLKDAIMVRKQRQDTWNGSNDQC